MGHSCYCKLRNGRAARHLCSLTVNILATKRHVPIVKMANNQDYTEDMAQGDFSNESSYGDFQQTAEAEVKQETTESNGNEAMEEATNGDAGHDTSSQDPMGKDEDR